MTVGCSCTFGHLMLTYTPHSHCAGRCGLSNTKTAPAGCWRMEPICGSNADGRLHDSDSIVNLSRNATTMPEHIPTHLQCVVLLPGCRGQHPPTPHTTTCLIQHEGLEQAAGLYLLSVMQHRLQVSNAHTNTPAVRC